MTDLSLKAHQSSCVAHDLGYAVDALTYAMRYGQALSREDRRNLRKMKDVLQSMTIRYEDQAEELWTDVLGEPDDAGYKG